VRALNAKNFEGAREFWSQFAIFVEKVEIVKQDELPFMVVVMSSLFVEIFLL
jgi:hypothetical protein